MPNENALCTNKKYFQLQITTIFSICVHLSVVNSSLLNRSISFIPVYLFIFLFLYIYIHIKTYTTLGNTKKWLRNNSWCSLFIYLFATIFTDANEANSRWIELCTIRKWTKWTKTEIEVQIKYLCALFYVSALQMQFNDELKIEVAMLQPESHCNRSK